MGILDQLQVKKDTKRVDRGPVLRDPVTKRLLPGTASQSPGRPKMDASIKALHESIALATPRAVELLTMLVEGAIAEKERADAAEDRPVRTIMELGKQAADTLIERRLGKAPQAITLTTEEGETARAKRVRTEVLSAQANLHLGGLLRALEEGQPPGEALVEGTLVNGTLVEGKEKKGSS
jgi:hypothetical protein